MASMATRASAGTATLPPETATGAKGGQDSNLFEPDLSKPLISQVGYLYDRYDDWVHTPVVTKKSPRLFESDFLEFFTKTYWWMIPLIWGPVVLTSSWLSFKHGITVETFVTFFALGIGLWSFLEYCIHRFWFHMRTTSYWGNPLHYFIHGYHHKHPQDEYRLVFPPLLTVPYLVSVAIPCALCLSTPLFWAGFAGGLLGYILYDVSHYMLHFGLLPKFDFVMTLRRTHMAHHFKNPNLNYGVTSPVWDAIIGTFMTK